LDKKLASQAFGTRMTRIGKIKRDFFCEANSIRAIFFDSYLIELKDDFLIR